MKFIGVDVSARVLDCSSVDGAYFKVRNTSKGFEEFVLMVPGQNTVAVEATGVYYVNFAKFLHEKGWKVYVLNPLAIKAYSQSFLSRIKTDKVDSALIASFIAERHLKLRPFEPRYRPMELISILVNYAESLKIQRVAMLNRIHSIAFLDPLVHADIASSVDDSKLLIAKLYKEIKARCAEDESISRDLKLIATLPGFSIESAIRLLAVVGDVRRFSSDRAFASFCGITPKIRQSGQMKSVPGISKLGPSGARRVLWLAAMSASNTASSYGDYYRKLLSTGKKPAKCIVALANRLARGVWHVLNSDSNSPVKVT